MNAKNQNDVSAETVLISAIDARLHAEVSQERNENSGRILYSDNFKLSTKEGVLKLTGKDEKEVTEVQKWLHKLNLHVKHNGLELELQIPDDAHCYAAAMSLNRDVVYKLQSVSTTYVRDDMETDLLNERHEVISRNNPYLVLEQVKAAKQILAAKKEEAQQAINILEKNAGLGATEEPPQPASNESWTGMVEQGKLGGRKKPPGEGSSLFVGC